MNKKENKVKHNHGHNHEHKHEHKHEHGDNHEGHDHNHCMKGVLIMFVLGLILHIATYFLDKELHIMILSIIAILLAGNHVIKEGLMDTINKSIKRKRFVPNIHILMLLAAIGALIIKEYKEATMLILIFAGAHFLEDYAEAKSRKEITGLLKLKVNEARLIKDGKVIVVKTEELKINDLIEVLAGDEIPTDGEIVKGNSSINEASITGESIPRDKKVSDNVFGSTINITGTIIVKVTKDPKDNVISKIIEMVRETEKNISKTAVLIKRIEPVYVNIIILLTPLFYLFALYILKLNQYDSFYRTMVFLIVASPCALAATDIPASLSAISNLAKRGVLFKGASYLSNLSDVKVVSFDKTGTLTTGNPLVTDIYFTSKDEKSNNKYLSIIKSLESKSNHPLALAIIKYLSNTESIELDVKTLVGTGLSAKYENKEYHIGKKSSFKNVSNEIENIYLKYSESGKTVIYFGTDDEVLVVLALLDVSKEGSKEVIDYLINSDILPVMITGDSLKTAQEIGKNLGISTIIADTMPLEKATRIVELKEKYGSVAMLGDGINDAIALSKADIGIAMGNGTDIAIDVADGVLMENDLSKFVYAHKVSKKLRRIVTENIFFSMFVVLFLITMNIIGLMNMPYAVLIHEGSTIVVILNGLRLLKKIE